MASVRIRESDTLPAVCILCGEAAVSTVYQNYSFEKREALGLVKREYQRRLGLPVCEVHRNYWSRRKWVAYLGLLAGVVCTGTLLPLTESPVALLPVPIVIVVIMIQYMFAMGPSDMDEMSVTLSGVSEGFVAALEETRAAQGEQWEQQFTEGFHGQRTNEPPDGDNPFAGLN